MYVTAAVDRPRYADGFIHPRHASSPVSTTVGSDELNRVWDELRESSRKIVLQIHTHPGGAFHSSIDDGFPIVHSVGFPSLVLPFFGRAGVDGAHLAIYQGDGQWFSPNLSEWDRYLVIENDQ